MENEFLTKVREAVASGDLDTAELLFLEEAENPEGKLEVLREAAAVVAAAGERERAGEMLAGLERAAEAAGPETHLDLLRQLCLWLPNRRPWRRAFVDAFTRYWGQDEQRMAFLKAADILNARDVAEAFERLEVLLHLHEGAYVVHPGGWGVGRVRKVLPLTGHLEVDLEQRRGHRVNLGAAATIFKPLAADHFSAMLFDRREELAALAEEDPRALLRLLLKSFGSPQAVSEIRNRLVPAVLPKEKWSGWWNRARTAIKHDPYLRLTGSPRPQLELREKPASELDDLLEVFKSEGGRQRLSVVRKFRGRSSEDRAVLLEAIEALEGGPVVKLEKLLLRLVLGEEEPSRIAEFLLEQPDGPSVLHNLEADELAREALRCLAQNCSVDVLIRYLLEAEVKTVDQAARLVKEADPERFKSVMREVFEQPRKYPLLFFWLARARTDPAWRDLLESFPAHEILLRHVALLDFLFRAERRQQARSIVTFGRQVLTGNKLAVFKALIEEAPLNGLRELAGQVQANRVLKESTKAVMLEQLVLREHELGERPKPEAAPAGGAGDREIIYTTEAALKKRRDEYQTLVQETIPEVIREVGRAQEFGDLSENAEWTAALEKRDHLAKRANEIEQELKRAVPITKEHYTPGKISLGCRFTVRDVETGRVHAWRLLGPWDAEIFPDALSYLSPIGEALLGKGEGETVTVSLPEGKATYVVERVEPGLPE